MLIILIDELAELTFNNDAMLKINSILNNDLNTCELDISVIFFRRGKSYYYTYKGETYEINKISINKLKEKLTVPFKVRFLALSRAQIEKIIYSFLDKDTDVVYDKIIKHVAITL